MKIRTRSNFLAVALIAASLLFAAPSQAAPLPHPEGGQSAPVSARISISPPVHAHVRNQSIGPVFCASRIATCTDSQLTYTSLDDKGEVTGVTVYDDRVSQTTSPTGGSVQLKYELERISTAGNILSGNLVVSVGGGGSMSLLISPAAVYSVGTTSYVPPISPGVDGTHATLTGEIEPFDGTAISGFTFIDPSVVRCDTTVRATAGCVNPEVTPTFDMTGYPNITPNVVRYQAAGQPGAPGGVPLTKIPGEESDANRADGPCKAFPSPRPDGEQCDEYPFASTLEGGPTALADLVPATENRSQGGNINNFYFQNRVVPGDKFFVKVQ